MQEVATGQRPRKKATRKRAIGGAMQEVAAIQRPSVEANLRKFAGNFATGVAVITAPGRAGTLCGLTMNAVTSLSLSPPLYLICLGNSSNTLAAVLDSGRFAINFLAAHQTELSKRFASKESNKFWGVAYSLGEKGCPLLDEALAACECEVQATYPGGDHKIIVGEVQSININGGQPMIFHNGKICS